MLEVSSSPHIRDTVTTRRLMLDVVFALIPALFAAFFFFGARPLAVVAVSISSAVLFEYVCRKVMKRYNSIGDMSAVVTGFLLALNLPPNIPLYIAVIGSFIAIVVVKQMFGGVGNNIINPAMAARVVLTISFPSAMSRWVILGQHAIGEQVDFVSSATPLYILQNGGQMPAYLDLFMGHKAGSLGEVSIMALCIGIAYLLFRKVITLWIPLSYIATVALITAVAGQNPLYHVLSGGLFLGAFFMATDYVTSPLTNKGKVIFGIGCGLMTAMIRLFGSMSEGVSFSIMLMNMLTPTIDQMIQPKVFGGGEARV
jgi:electron transport complex protein RnfD